VRLGAVLVVGAALYGYLRYRIEAPLREAVARLDREEPGWRLADIEAVREVIPEEENSARAVAAAAVLMPRGRSPYELSGTLGQVPPERRLARAQYGRLCKVLDEANQALAEARRLADLPRGRYPFSYRGGATVPAVLPHQEATSRVARLLLLAALRECDEGNADRALVDCRAAVNTARSLGDEPLPSSQSFRRSLVAFGCKTAERVLAHGEPAPEVLAAMQRLLEEEDAFPAEWAYRRAERAEWHENLVARERAPRHSEEMDLRRFIERLRVGLGSEEAELYARHGLMLSAMTRAIATARLPPHEQATADAGLDADTRTLDVSGIGVSSLEGFFSHGQYSRGLRAGVRCLIVCLACERHRRSPGRWPAALDDLVPAQLAAVPLDPFDGKPLRYRRLPDGGVIYSVGPNGKADGATFDDVFLRAWGTENLTYRLWDPDKRRQPPAGE
jgi:hypothetical protein